jgi:hypothetical protein
MAVLADLLVRFGADSAELRKTLKTVQSDLKSFGHQVEGIKSMLEAAFVATGIEAVSERLAEMVVSGAEAAEMIGKMAEVAGTSVEQMSQLAYAAKLSDVSTDELSKGMLKFSETLSKAAVGGTEQAAAFAAMGFSAQDVTGMVGDTHGALLEFADKIAGYSDGTAKAALVSEVFGDRLARQLLPFLNKGAAGIAELETESNRLGKTLSAATVEGADLFNESMKRMSGTAEVFGAMLAANLAPTIDATIRSFGDGSEQAVLMAEAVDDLADSLRVLASVGLGFSGSFAGVGKTVAMVAGVARGQSFREMGGVISAWKEDMQSSADRLDKLNAALWTKHERPPSTSGLADVAWAPEGDPQSHQEWKPPAPDVNKIAEAQKAMKLLADAGAEYQKKLATFGKGDFAQLQWELQFGKFAEAARQAGNEGAAALSKLNAVIVKFGAAEEAEKAAKATKELTGELGKLQAELSGKTSGDNEYEKMLARIMSGDLREKLEASGAAAVRYSEDLLGSARALDEFKRKNDEAKVAMERFKSLVDQAEELGRSTRTAWEQFREEIEKINVLLAATAINYDTAVRGAARALTAALPEVNSFLEQSTNRFLQAVVEGKGTFEDVWKSVFDSFAAMVEQMVAKWIVGQLVMAAASAALTGSPAAAGAVPPGVTSGVGGILLDSFGGFAAEGGPVTGGTAYIVGERGPEMFVPSVSGKIVPNDQLGGRRSITLNYSPRLLDGRHASEWWDRNEDLIVKKLDRLSYLGRTGG